MDKETKEATLGSIKKWKDIRDGEGVDLGPTNCPLCKMFRNGSSYEENFCKGCPVKEETNLHSCMGTPYTEWTKHQNREHMGERRKLYCSRCKELAEKEVVFLKSLLEEAPVQ